MLAKVLNQAIASHFNCQVGVNLPFLSCLPENRCGFRTAVAFLAEAELVWVLNKCQAKMFFAPTCLNKRVR